MVKIVNYQVRKNKAGEDFVSLDLQGDLVMVQSSETGRFYATCKRCSVTSTFSEEEAKTLIGKELPGNIRRVASESYDFTVPETGEVITLAHRWEYLPEEVPAASQFAGRELVV